MDFFSEQDKARKNTSKLIWMFILAVLAIVVLVYLAAMAAYGFSSEKRMIWWHPGVAGAAIGGSLLIIAIGTLYRTASLNAGGKVVAEMMGGMLIHPDTPDPDERRVLNVVEEMAIASGLPVPPVYIMEEEGINAFAAGYRGEDAVIGVTRGCIERLTRDELQGVIAHEFSHILHGDMRINIRLMGILFGILGLAIVGSILMRAIWFAPRRRSSRDNSGAVVYAIAAAGLALYILGYVGVFFGNLIKAAVSRQREFLADASAVQFTRNPDGIGGALKRLGGYHSRVQNPQASEASHMFFGNISSMAGMLSTHPPLAERIKRIDPSFDANEAKKAAAGDSAALAAGAAGFAGGNEAPTETRAAPKQQAQPVDRVLGSIGDPRDEHMEYSRQLLASIPDIIRKASRDTWAARSCIYALLIDGDDQALANEQWKGLEQQADTKVFAYSKKLYPHIAQLEPEARLPLLELCLPALDNLSEGQRQRFLSVVEYLVVADNHVSVFEFALRHQLRLRLDPNVEMQRRSAGKAKGTDVKVLLSAVAHVGAESTEEAGEAFVAAAGTLNIPAQRSDLMDPKAADWQALETSLLRLGRAGPGTKKGFIYAAAHCVAHDGMITPNEGDLIRAICASLDCPMPPLVGAHEDEA